MRFILVIIASIFSLVCLSQIVETPFGEAIRVNNPSKAIQWYNTNKISYNEIGITPDIPYSIFVRNEKDTLEWSLQCFAPETQVLLPNYKAKEISLLEVGDTVSAYNSKTHKFENACVLELGSTTHDKQVKVSFENGATIVTTTNHKFYLGYNKWAAYSSHNDSIAELKLGMPIINNMGMTYKITNIEVISSSLKMYTITKLSTGDAFIVEGVVVKVEE